MLFSLSWKSNSTSADCLPASRIFCMPRWTSPLSECFVRVYATACCGKLFHCERRQGEAQGYTLAPILFALVGQTIAICGLPPSGALADDKNRSSAPPKHP